MPRAPSLWLSTVSAAISPASPLSTGRPSPSVEASRECSFGVRDDAGNNRARRLDRLDQVDALAGPDHGSIEILRRRCRHVALLVRCGGLQFVFAAMPRIGEAVGEA